jgi:hypothetical protein
MLESDIASLLPLFSLWAEIVGIPLGTSLVFAELSSPSSTPTK